MYVANYVFSLKVVAFVSSSSLLIVLLALGPLFEHLPRVSDLVMGYLLCMNITGMLLHESKAKLRTRVNS